jgi:hypothetical protein
VTINNTPNLSIYKKVFCDSKQAIAWAYKNKLPKDAIILSSSPAMLWESNPNIKHVECRWTLSEMKRFQGTINKFAENIFDVCIGAGDISHEEALCVAQATIKINRILFKAACLNEGDLINPILFIRVEGSGGAKGNNLNSPWDLLLDSNPNFKVVNYALEDESVSCVENISLKKRVYVAGIRTIYYRSVTKILSFFQNYIFRKQILILGENELLIDTAVRLLIHGFPLKQIKPFDNIDTSDADSCTLNCRDTVLDIITRRTAEFVTPCLVNKCANVLIREIDKQLDSYYGLRLRWETIIKKYADTNTALLTNAPVNPNSLAVISLCREIGIPTISAQHGVSQEICATHSEVSVVYDINAVDCFLSYNAKSKEVANSSHFIRGYSFVSGISERHLRMKKNTYKTVGMVPIIYVSTNLYKGNLGWFGTWLTDYDRARNEQRLINSIFAKIPHNVCYKSYPVDNIRYPDKDPVLHDIESIENLSLFDKKIDMRYLLDEYRVLVTSMATSTLSWLVMADKPVIFINSKNNMPLTVEARNALSKGLFLFDDDEDNFSERLRNFLSKPIDEIEHLWYQKESDRKIMIKRYFSAYENNSGKIAAEFIYDKYITPQQIKTTI